MKRFVKAINGLIWTYQTRGAGQRGKKEVLEQNTKLEINK